MDTVSRERKWRAISLARCKTPHSARRQRRESSAKPLSPKVVKTEYLGPEPARSELAPTQDARVDDVLPVRGRTRSSVRPLFLRKK